MEHGVCVHHTLVVLQGAEATQKHMLHKLFPGKNIESMRCVGSLGHWPFFISVSEQLGPTLGVINRILFI
jgi:hypothetical protein